MASTKRQQILKLLRQHGMLRPRDLQAVGISPGYLNQLSLTGVLHRLSRGLYVLADAKPQEHQSFAEACKRVPHGIVCLLSALQFHGLTTQAPFEVWITISKKA